MRRRDPERGPFVLYPPLPTLRFERLTLHDELINGIVVKLNIGERNCGFISVFREFGTSLGPYRRFLTMMGNPAPIWF